MTFSFRLRARPARLSLVLAMLLAAPALAHASSETSHAPVAAHSAQALAQACQGRDGWTDSAPPARIFANTWYVGTCGIAAILVSGDQGHVLIDGGPAEAAPMVLANIAALGFKAGDIRWIVSSHEHNDHIGALAALQRATGAKIAALRSAVPVFESGQPLADDPQFGAIDGIAPVAVDRILADGDSVVVGGLALTVHATPTHSPGSASWTWQSCTDDFTCRMIAYADSATTISADGYRFRDHPERVAAANTGLGAIAALPCDILLSPHPSASAMMERFSGDAPLIDPQACRSYAQNAKARFAARLERETETQR